MDGSRNVEFIWNIFIIMKEEAPLKPPLRWRPVTVHGF